MNYVVSIVPYTLLKPLGLAKYSLDAVAGVNLHRDLRRGLWKYIQISAKKPDDRITEECTRFIQPLVLVWPPSSTGNLSCDYGPSAVQWTHRGSAIKHILPLDSSPVSCQ